MINFVEKDRVEEGIPRPRLPSSFCNLLAIFGGIRNFLMNSGRGWEHDKSVSSNYYETVPPSPLKLGAVMVVPPPVLGGDVGMTLFDMVERLRSNPGQLLAFLLMIGFSAGVYLGDSSTPPPPHQLPISQLFPIRCNEPVQTFSERKNLQTFLTSSVK